MTRTVLALMAQVVLAILVALLFGASWQAIVTGATSAAAGEAARLLFLFMDIGLGVWLVALIVLTVRRRALPGVGATLLAAVAGVVLNALAVFVVGLVQGVVYLAYAIEAGVAFLIAVLVTAPIIHRLFRGRVKPPREVAPRA
jgi:hypothetical protein